MKVRNNKQKLIILLIIIGTIFTCFTSKDLVNKNKTYKNTIIKETTESNKSVIAAYIKQEDGTYKEVESIPQEGYQLNTSKSTCSNGTIPGWDVKNKRFYADNLTKGGTSCYLYFDKIEGITIDDIIASTNYKTTTPTTFASGTTTDEGVYSIGDPVYGGTSYYWRGLVTNNYVKFADKCWRIVRINGDGSIRLIYDGTTCHANGSNADSIAKTSVQYNASYDQSNYVGWTYSGTSQRTTGGTASNAKTQLESWYSSNITETNAQKVASGKYCNDRNAQSGNTWAINGSTFYYAGYKRIYTDYSPSLTCNSDDVYTLKVGLITVDEAMYAGGTDKNQTSHYLYNGQNYWTISPIYWNGYARVFCVNVNGNLGDTGVNSTRGLRPVINLKADTLFAIGGIGTQSNPYVVTD